MSLSLKERLKALMRQNEILMRTLGEEAQREQETKA